MCGLCGVFGGEHHWTAGGAPREATPDVHRRRLERARRIAFVNEALAARRLTIREWQGVSYILSSPTGQSDIVGSLGDLWLAVERMTGRPFDPLEDLDA